MAHPKGGYKNAAGKRVPGVTTICGRFKDSAALLWWAFDQGKAAERGEINYLYDKRDAAAESGTLAHAMVEAHIAERRVLTIDLDGVSDAVLDEAESALKALKESIGQLLTVDLDGVSDAVLDEAESAFASYLAWESQSRLEIVEQEIQLVSERYQFGGCPDAIGRINGELCLVDWKTGSGIYTDYLCQIAAYGILWNENHPDQQLTGGYHLCRFSKSHGDFHHHYFADLSDAEQQFILFRQAYDIDKILRKRAK